MDAPKTLATDRECAACRKPALEWVLVMPGTDRPYRALCASCCALAKTPGISAVDCGYRTWWFL